jgi:hypothetical protein
LGGFALLDIPSELCHTPQQATIGAKGLSIAFAFAASRSAIIEKSAIQNFFSSNSNTVLTVEMMLASSMCNAASVEIRGQNFEKNLRAGARVFPETQLREWAASADSSPEGLGNNSGVNGKRRSKTRLERASPGVGYLIPGIFSSPYRSITTNCINL